MVKNKVNLLESGRQLFSRFEKGRWYREAKNYLSNREKMHSLLGLVAHLFRNRALAPVLKDLILLFFYTQDVTAGRYKDYNRCKLVMIVAVLIYVVTPLDLVPDWLPVAGFLDDAALLGYVVKLADKELEQYYKWNRGQRSKEVPAKI